MEEWNRWIEERKKHRLLIAPRPPAPSFAFFVYANKSYVFIVLFLLLTYIIERGRFKKPRKTSKEILLKFSEHCWEKLSDKQVAHFEALAQIDQERYEAELRVFHPKRSDLHLMATPLMSLPKEPLILSPETKKPLFTVITGRLPPLHILTNCIILLLKKIEPETAISCRMIRKRLEQEFNVSFRHRKRMIEVILLTLIE